MPYDQAILILDIYVQQKMYIYVYQKTQIKVSIVAHCSW